MRAATAAARGCDAAWRGEANNVQTSPSLNVSTPGSKASTLFMILKYFVFCKP